MNKLYTLIIITLLPLLTFSQTPNLPDSETGLSATELKDMRRSNIETKETKALVTISILKIKKETNDPNMVQILAPKSTTGVVWNTDYIMSPPAPIREEDCDDEK